MQLVRFIYISRPVEAVSLKDMVQILESARETNEKESVTGMLCFGEGYFLQCLEGGRTAVNRVYQRILADPRHTDCEVAMMQNVDQRLFPQWSMAYVPVSGTGASPIAQAVLSCSVGGTLDPFMMSDRQLLKLLESLKAHRQDPH